MSRTVSSVRRRPPPNVPYLPTHNEIDLACARIRAGWDEPERRKRAGLAPVNQSVLLAEVALGVLEGRST